MNTGLTHIFGKHGGGRDGHPHQGERPDLEMFRGMRHDHVTGLSNRHGFHEALERRLTAGHPTALVLIDIDQFSTINAVIGHRQGDQILLAIADRLRGLHADHDHIARLGDDEFGVLLDAAHGLEAVEAAVLHLLRTLTEPLAAGLDEVTASSSLGVALTPTHAQNADGLIRAATAALTSVKAAGGGTWRVFDPHHDIAQQARTQMKVDLQAAIHAGEIVPYYQPIIDLQAGRMVSLEVLARWHHHERAPIPPDIFIPLAEEMDLETPLTTSLMRRVLADQHDWPPHLTFAFNLSPGQMRDVISLIRNPPAWPEGHLDPRRMEIEIAAVALGEEAEAARDVMAELQSHGTRLVLDDFGTGTANITQLRQLPFDRVKIDRSFILDIAHDPRAEACVRGMLTLGQSLNIDMVAEAIETQENASLLAGLGCRFGQGYLFSRPVPSEEVASLCHRYA
jgi:diguanylate cyclase (GGDEF)-like protein